MASFLGCFNGPEVLEDVNHAGGLMRELKALYDSRLLSDVTIAVDPDGEPLDPGGGYGEKPHGDSSNQLFLCSRNVLAAASPYFKSMFTGGMNESVQEKVVIRGVDVESMSVIVDYCYTGTVTITEGNVQRLYAAANMLQLEYIKDACSSFMTRRLDLSNCVGVLKFADTYDNPELKASAQAFIAMNFGQLCSGGELCELDLVQLKELLSLDTLDVDCERKVCSAALQWIEVNAPQKKEDALQALRCVRWSLFTEKDKRYLEGLVASPFIEKYLESFFNGPAGAGCCALSASLDVPKHRIGVSAKEMILFFGLPNDHIICCDPYSEDLYFISPPLVDLSSQDYKRSTMESLIACSTPENNLYLASHLSKHFWQYNPVLNTWKELAERPLGRIHSGMGYLNGHVYLLGGRNPVTDARLKEVECYSVQRNQWTFVAPLPHSLGKMQVVALNDHLYVVNKRRMLCYDPRRNRWRHCGSLRRDKLHKACVYQDQIICVCDIPVVKAYSPARGEWRRLGDIPIDSRALNYQVIQHSGKLLLLTQTLLQHNKNRVLMHEYDLAQESWKTVMAVYVSTLGPVCVSTRVYPACLGSAHSFSMEEDDDSGSSADWDLDGLTDADSDSGSSSSFSDENW
ncbi:kelch repeat and BTB domain-containing protein 7 [Dunckerocampus dactyliophorus]|uniref:kelch repeat and BTB domain-containing protein 7 n=1 Tax=Dunckerocampus dactyliophorus TaxID=161453 RepID=UPI0024065D96|nr:kelch repeat and BTB domain-containing protein 7 [Dunckerocampus dactyliophorus]